MKILFKIMMLNLFLVPCYAQDEKNIVLRKMQYSSDPLPESKGGYLVRNQNFVHGTLQFQQKYGPAMIYWEKEKSKLEADFIYLRYSTDIGGLVLKTSCKEFKYNDKIYYLLSGHTNSPTDLYRVAFAIVEPLSTPKSLKRLEKLTGDEALVSYYTHPSFYDKNKTEDFQGCKIISQKIIELTSIEISQFSPSIKIIGHKLEISNSKNKELKISYDLANHKFLTL